MIRPDNLKQMEIKQCDFDSNQIITCGDIEGCIDTILDEVA